MDWINGRAAVLLLSLLLTLQAFVAARADTGPFPRPAELERDIGFWVKVYTEIDTAAGFIHDSRRLDIIYERIAVPPGLSSRSRQKRVEQVKKRYQAVLRKLAGDERGNLGAEEQRVLALWPEDVTSQELRAAAEHLRFQLGQSDRFRAGLERSGAWLHYIKQRFAAAGLPVELAYLPHVESSFNPRAYSHAAAAGMWQFTHSTGRRYMRIDHEVDERMDPFFATDAAVRLLRDNHADTGTWPLALTAYNHGVAGMRRAVRQLGTSDIATIVREYRSRSFGFASRNFYVSFLAALDVERNVEQYFGAVQRAPARTAETVTLDAWVPAPALAQALQMGVAELASLNPALSKSVWRGDKLVPRDFPLRIPPGHGRETMLAALAGIPAAERFSAQYPDLTYRVARGDTLSQIAARFGISVTSLVQTNGLRSRHSIRAGQTLSLPQVAGRSTATVATRSGPQPFPADGSYQVRNGDSLSRIAARFGVPEQALAEHNALRDRHRIHAGQILQIPSAGTRTGLVEYTVRPGDTLSRLAARFGISESELAASNGLTNKHRIFVGQKLRLARAGDAAAETAANPVLLNTGLPGQAVLPVSPRSPGP